MMRKMSTWFLPHASFWFWLLFLISPAMFAGVESGSVRDVEAPYVKYGCYQCHGFKGQGALMTGAPQIVSDMLPFEAFAEIVRRPYGKMPPFAPDVLDTKTLKEIYKYLESIDPYAQQDGDADGGE